MATGDIIGFEILGTTDHNGFVAEITVAGWASATGIAIANGFGANNVPTAPKLLLAITSASRTTAGASTTTTRTGRGSMIMKQADPNDALDDITTSGSDAKIKVAIDTQVFSGDTVSYTILAGLFTSSLGSSAAASGSATNSSTIGYRTPFFRWLWSDEHAPRRAVGTSCKVAVLARKGRHRADDTMPGGVAGVRGTATGATSTLVATASTSTMIGYQYDQGSGLWCNVHELTFDLTGFTAGEQVSIDVVVEPLVGDTPFNSSDHAADDRAMNWGTIEVTFNPTHTYAAVDGVGGSAATAASEAAARLTPYATVAAAINAGATIIVLEAGSYSIWGAAMSTIANKFWRVIRPASGVSASSVTLAFTATASNHTVNMDYLCLQDLKLLGDNTASNNRSYMTGNGTARLWCNRVAFTKGSGGIPVSPFSRQMVYCVTTECTIDDANYWKYAGGDSTRRNVIFEFGSTSATGDRYDAFNFYAFVCHKHTGTYGFSVTLAPTWTSAPAPQGFVGESNELKKMTQTAFSHTTVQCHDTAWQGNVLESHDYLTGALEAVIVEGSLFDEHQHLNSHNTVAGQRCNRGYNNNPSDTTRYARNGWEELGNNENYWANKGDVFAGHSTQTGNWPRYYGVDRDDTRIETEPFPPNWRGSNCILKSQMDVVGEKSQWNGTTYATDTGGGDYTPTSDGNLVATLTKRALRYDLYGTEFPSSEGSIGGIQLEDDAMLVVSVDGVEVLEDGSATLSAGSHTLRITASGGDVIVSSVTLGGGVGGTITGLIDTITDGDDREATIDVTADGSIRISSDAGDGNYDITVVLRSAFIVRGRDRSRRGT